MAKLVWRSVRAEKRRAAILDLNSIARKEIEETVKKKVKPALVKSHERIVSDWNSKPEFKSRLTIKPKEMSVFIFPAGTHKLIWKYVDQGTKPHPILPKRKPLLKFRWDGKGSYKAKTLPKPARTVSGGGTTQGNIVAMKAVNHPGIEAREFSKIIGEDSQEGFRREIENAFRRAARKTEE